MGTFGGELLVKILAHFRRGRAVQSALAQQSERSFPGKNIPCLDSMMEHSGKIPSHFPRGRAVQSAITQEIEGSFSGKKCTMFGFDVRTLG